MALMRFLMIAFVAAVLVACGDDGSSNPVSNFNVGSMVDERDGQIYKTVKIGDQVWMAENLNYETENSFSQPNRAKYGRYYLWSTAMDSAGMWSMNGKDCGNEIECSPAYPVRGVCPEGWHLPDTTEWKTLFTAVGGSSTAGKMLKSTSGWCNSGSGNGTDDYSFAALPAGEYFGGYYGSECANAYFWSSTEFTSSRAYSIGLSFETGGVYLYNALKYEGYSVRCLKD